MTSDLITVRDDSFVKNVLADYILALSGKEHKRIVLIEDYMAKNGYHLSHKDDVIKCEKFDYCDGYGPRRKMDGRI